jgi:hypothetical protein
MPSSAFGFVSSHHRRTRWARTIPFDTEWVLDWAHVGRMLRHVDRSITPLAYGRLTANGLAFELWDLLVR